MAKSNLLIQSIQGVTVVSFQNSSVLDSAVIDAIGADLNAIIETKNAKKVLIDFDHVKFLASQAVGALITMKKKADASGAKVVICCLRPEIKRVFKIMNLTKLFTFAETEKEALAEFDVYLS